MSSIKSSFSRRIKKYPKLMAYGVYSNDDDDNNCIKEMKNDLQKHIFPLLLHENKQTFFMDCKRGGGL